MAGRDDQQREGGFKITDRRKFTSEGELRPEAAAAAPAKPQPAPPHPASAAPPAREAPGEPGVESAFERLVVSFASTTMMQLGLMALDPGQPLEPDLAGARETIDMLGVLEEKTRGNLTAREERLLRNTVAELRMAFVEVQRRGDAGL